MSTTLSTLVQRLSEAIGDWREFDTSTNVTTAATPIVKATTLNNYDNGRDDYFNTWWLYFTEGNNDGIQRNISDYATSSAQITLRGSAFASESSAVTLELHRYNRDLKVWAINRALEELFPAIFRKLEDRTMITGSILPDNSFEMWTSSTVSSFFSTSNCSIARTTSSGYLRGLMATSSMKVTDSGSGDGYAYVSSDSYHRLLDLAGRTINFKCWARPSTADDAFLTVAWTRKDGSTDSENSTTTCVINEFTLLEIEDLDIPDDIVDIQFRFRVHSAGENVYFDSARVTCGITLYEYLLLSDFDDGYVSQVFVQLSGHSDDICDDMFPRYWEPATFSLIHDGTYKFLRLDDAYTNNKQIRVIGYAPFESLSADTDSIALDGERINLVVAKAAEILYRRLQEPVSSEDKGRYSSNINYWAREVARLKPSMVMIRPHHTLRV